VKEITALGLKYSLLTQYTSFVAIDKKVRNVGGKQETVEQVLPLPQACPTTRSAAARRLDSPGRA